MTRLGIIGLGDMGGAIAEGVLTGQWDDDVTVVGYDISEEAMGRFTELGGVPAGSVGELARQVDLVAVVVIDDVQVRQVCTGDDGAIVGAAESGALVAIHSTVLPATVIETAAEAAAVGVTVIDAPVTGGAASAQNRDLVVFCGGDEAHTEQGRPHFERYGGMVINVGPLGAGLQAKVARNLISYAEFAVAYEAIALAAAAGVDLKAFADIVSYSDRNIGPHMGVFSRPIVYPPPSFGGSFTRIAHKDLGGALALGEELGVDLPITALVDQHIDGAFGE
ncbi:MAG: NAD(P)-dependent oxidoreductase [Acidimicrobiia bacterium]|nr:NAD(P)-dependent oxidoreductase [Acidimicrobiia bacterium]MCY4435458.1 NAD(P)-dependent oxidoreductase [bacterium]